MDEVILGKISDVFFGKKDGRIGLWVTLSGSWSVQASYAFWDPEEVTIGKHHKWTEEEREKGLADIMYKLSELMNKAKVNDINSLLNIPVEITTKKGMLDTWRILEEVL